MLHAALTLALNVTFESFFFFFFGKLTFESFKRIIGLELSIATQIIRTAHVKSMTTSFPRQRVQYLNTISI